MGSQEKATRKSLRHLRAEGKLTGRDALVELAVTLSRHLDAGEWSNAMAVPALSKELRATMMELGKPHDSVGDEAESWLAGLSAPVEHPED